MDGSSRTESHASDHKKNCISLQDSQDLEPNLESQAVASKLAHKASLCSPCSPSMFQGKRQPFSSSPNKQMASGWVDPPLI